MSKFFKLLINELMKIYVRKSTWAMYAILVAIVVGGIVITITVNEIDTEYTDNWREELKQENETIEVQQAKIQRDIEESGMTFEVHDLENQINKNNYYLENDIKPLNYGAWQYVLDNAGLVSLISLFTIIIGAGIVASEFRWGTIKLLLIRPVSRTMILISKFVAVLLYAFFTLIFLWIISFISGAIVFGFEGFNPSIVLQKADGLVYVPLVGEVLSEYGYNLVNLVMMTTFAFMISTIFRNSSIAIGIGIFLMMGGNMVVQIFSNYDWSKFILFANTNLKQYETGHVLVEGMTLGFSITVLIVYFVVFMALSWVFFNKRDVAGH